MQVRFVRGLGGRPRLASGAIGVGLFIALAAPIARAAECAPTDLTCLAQQGHDTLGGLGGTLGSGQDPVGGVTNTAGKVVNTVNDTLDGLLNGGSGGGGGPGGGSGGGSGNPGHHHGASTTIASRTFSTSSGSTATAPTTSTTPVVHQARSELRTVGGTVVRAAQQVGFPMILAFVVALFVMVQNRLDRNDPKLSMAPLRPDRMRFV
jgi:hypothetical protein